MGSQVCFHITLPVGIALYQTSYYTEYGLTLATSVLSTMPLILVFMAFQRQIIESMSTSGLKEWFLLFGLGLGWTDICRKLRPYDHHAV